VTADSYYGRPILKEPVWKPEVACYFFTGGIAGGSAVLHGLAKLTGNERLARSTLWVGAAAEAVCPPLLISDLGRPERFLNMLRVFKVTSPMSVGSWILFVSGGASATAAALERLRLLGPLRELAEGVWFMSGPPLATYTGALLANTANPVWSEARNELPWLFGASAVACAGAAATLVTPPACATPARRAAIGGALAELGLGVAMEEKLGFVGEVYKQGEAGKYARLSKALTATGSVVLAAGGRRSRKVAVAGSALVLAGGMALRWSVFKAGFQSARDPKYTVVPQKERAATRRAEAHPGSAPD
jgi:formate-dependent nitrite reductase membrane component NrfD